MIETHSPCIKISDTKSCPFCSSKKIIKNGHTKTHKQQYFCKDCTRRFLDFYTYNACKLHTNNSIILLTKEGVGIRSIARILKISTTTLLKRYLSISKEIKQPIISFGQKYEVDELNFFMGWKKKKMWLVCALDKKTRKVVSFSIGKRTNKNLNVVIKTLKNAMAEKIYTDRLGNYTGIIPKEIHNTRLYGTNHIERENLNIRTHLKRFSRKTICFGKSIAVTTAILKIYFWA